MVAGRKNKQKEKQAVGRRGAARNCRPRAMPGLREGAAGSDGVTSTATPLPKTRQGKKAGQKSFNSHFTIWESKTDDR